MEGIILTGFVFAFGATALLYAWKSAAPVMPFLYSNARIQARSRYLIPEKQWASLAECSSLQDLTALLRETDYEEEVEKAKDLKEFHLAIEKSFASSVEELKRMTPDAIDPLFDAYLMFWEAKMLKTVYRARLTGQELDPSLIFSLGTLNATLLRHLQETETLADIKVVMEGTVYEHVFRVDHETLEGFEAALDDFIFHEFVRRANKTKTYDGQHIIELLNLKFDLQNLLVLLKLEARNVPEDQRVKYIIRNGTELCKNVSKIIYAKDIKEFVDLCCITPYKQPLQAALQKYEQDGSLSHFEHELYKYYNETITGMELYHIQGPYPLFSYLVKKEIEMKNLMVVSKGIDAKMPPEKVKELII